MSTKQAATKVHQWPVPIEGGCGCTRLRYRLHRSPMIIHCCNCESCQRETGSAFAVNLMVEADDVELLSGSQKCFAQTDTIDQQPIKPKLTLMPSESGQGQLIARCPMCFVALWSHYPGGGPLISFIRCGTLDKAGINGTCIKNLVEPDTYIFAEFKQPWVCYPKSAEEAGNVVDQFYDPGERWPDEVKQRFAATREKYNEWVERGRRWDELGDIRDLR